MHTYDGKLKLSQFPTKRCKIYQRASEVHCMLQPVTFLEGLAVSSRALLPSEGRGCLGLQSMS